MNKEMDLGKLGKYTLDQILVEYDYPFIFTCKNEKFKTMLFVEENYTDEYESWISIFVNDDDLYNLLSSRKSIQKTFININIDRYYKIIHQFSTDSYEVSRLSSFPEGILGKDEYFLNFYDEKHAEKLINSSYELFNENLMPVMDVHFNPYTNSHSIGVSFLVNFLENVKKVYNGIVRCRKDTLNVMPCGGSFVLRFQSAVPDKTISKNTSEYAFNSIQSIFLSSDLEEVKDLFIKNPRIYHPVKDLYDTLAKENRDFEILTISGAEQVKKYKKVSSDYVSKFKESLKNSVVSSTEETKMSGFLEGFDNVRSTFTLITENGDIIKGKLSKSLNDRKPKIKDKFEALIEVTKELDLENGKEKPFYKMLEIKPI